MSGIGKPDYVIGGSHPIFGSKPVAVQFGQCGVSGIEIQLPFKVLTEFQNLTKQTGEIFHSSLQQQQQMYLLFNSVNLFNNNTLRYKVH
jgi:hypothetical protein